MRLVCDENILNLDLEDFLNQREPLILAYEPFNRKLQILLKIKKRNEFKALCCLPRYKTSAFTTPKYVFDFASVPPQTYLILTHDETGYAVFFCLSHQGVLTTCRGRDEGLELELLSTRPNATAQARNVFVCLRGANLEQTMKLIMETALQATGGMGKSIEEKFSSPVWMDRLGWESGISLGSNVSHMKVVEAVVSLQKSGFNPGYILIDEGWQNLAAHPLEKGENLAMLSFGADPTRFPSGIKGLVADLHQIGIKQIGVWHGIMGSHGGVHPALARTYDLPVGVNGRYILGDNLGQTFQFFYDYYSYLREQGITFIKVGGQGDVQLNMQPGADPTRLHKNLQSAIQAAGSIQFNSAPFNTDCLRNENLFYWANSRLARTAEDIDLSNPVGMMRSIRNNLTNALWLQPLMQPDFDAWLTNVSDNETLAIFHALSGTINVIGDLAGEHHVNLLKKMILPGGVILKADRPLTICEDSIFINPLEEKKIYKAYTMKGQYGLIGAFNLTAGKRTLHGRVSPKDIAGLRGSLFAVLSHHNGFVGLVKQEESIPITLKPNQSDVLTFAPVKKGIAVLGCYPFFLTPGPLQDINVQEDSLQISTLVVAPLIVYCEKRVLEVRRDDVAVPWEYDSKRKILSIDSRTHIEGVHSVCSVVFES